jgi:hypothetical protein
MHEKNLDSKDNLTRFSKRRNQIEVKLKTKIKFDENTVTYHQLEQYF